MNAVFDQYSNYYNLLYQDKNYSAEQNFIQTLIRQYGDNVSHILELGSGTGKHAQLFAQQGYTIHGVELSPSMLDKALRLRSDQPKEIQNRLSFSQGNLCTVTLDKTFDTVLSLFHVMSYQTHNADINAAFQTARWHLKPGGLFIFDVWYGPAVLSQRPCVRVKRLENDSLHITRIAEPVLDINANLVNVNYTILIKDKTSNQVEELRESHPMRYFFKPELELLFDYHDFNPLACGEWLTDQPPSQDSWGVYWVLQSRSR